LCVPGLSESHQPTNACAGRRVRKRINA
jgi:hypothetical protein